MNVMLLAEVIENNAEMSANEAHNVAISPMMVSIITSALVFLICEVFLKRLLIEPWNRYQILKERTAYCLSFYEPFYSKPLRITNENENTDKAKQYMTAKEELRNCSAQLRGFSEILPCLHIGVPAKKDISKAADQLLVLSCTVVDSIWERLSDRYREPTSQDVIDAVNETKKVLKIK